MQGGVPLPEFFFKWFEFMVLSQKLIVRYREMKLEAKDCVLLMQVGAFMQVMDNDAKILSQLKGLKLQMAGEVDDPVVLGGFPKSGLDAYTGKLVRAGHSVAIALQDNEKQSKWGQILTGCCPNKKYGENIIKTTPVLRTSPPCQGGD